MYPINGWLAAELLKDPSWRNGQFSVVIHKNYILPLISKHKTSGCPLFCYFKIDLVSVKTVMNVGSFSLL